MLRIIVYFEDVPACTRPIFFARTTFDFGDAAAGVFLEIAERKVVAGRCSISDTIKLIKERRYVDNLNDYYRSPVFYHLVKTYSMQLLFGSHLKNSTQQVSADDIPKFHKMF